MLLGSYPFKAYYTELALLLNVFLLNKNELLQKAQLGIYVFVKLEYYTGLKRCIKIALNYAVAEDGRIRSVLY